MDAMIQNLIHEGGFALLAALAIYLIYKVEEARIDDLKRNREREAQLTGTVLEALQENTAAITSLTDEIGQLLERRRSQPAPSLNDTWNRRRKPPEKKEP